MTSRVDTIEIEAKLTVSKETADLCRKLLEVYANQTNQVIMWGQYEDGRYEYDFKDGGKMGDL